MAIRFFFEFENTIIQLPVNPEEVYLETESNNKIVEIVNLGQINLLREEKLKTLKIECFFPNHSDSPYVLTTGRFESPQFYIDFFEKVKTEKQPCRFAISDTKINFLCSIEKFKWGYQAGDDDVHYSLSIMENKPFSSQIVKIQIPESEMAETDITTGKMSPPPAVERAKTGFAIGDNIIANGKYWASSYGDEPSGIFNDFAGKISTIVPDNSREYRYHITTIAGNYRGWVNESQLKHG